MADEQKGAGEWAVAKVVESQEEATIIVGFLEASGIEAAAESLYVEELPVHLGSLGEVRVRVPRQRLQEALDLLASREAAPPSSEPEEAAEPSGEAAPAAGEDPDER